MNNITTGGWEPQFNDLYDYRRFSEIAFPTYRYDSSLFSGSNNYTMPVVDYGHGLETRAFVGGPHLVGLGMLAEGMRHRTGSSSQTADRIFPVGQYERGNYTFKDNSYSSVETETGSVKMHYEDHGGGKGGITAQITSWDSDEGKEKKDNVNIDVRYS